jgi:hypothetical protein
MAGVTHYVALPFAMGDDGPVAREAIECLSAGAAIVRAETSLTKGRQHRRDRFQSNRRSVTGGVRRCANTAGVWSCFRS